MDRFRLALLLSALAAAGCATHQPVTREALARSVEAALASERPCIADKSWIFPAKAATNDAFSADVARGFDALVKAGLVQSAATTDTVERFTLGPDGGSRDAAVAAKEYTLTSAGTAAYRAYDSPGYGRVGGFCFGRWRAEVAGFTDPAESPEGKHTTVTYTRRLVDVPAWAEVPVLSTRRTDLAHRIGTGVQERMDLVQTDTGWVRAGF